MLIRIKSRNVESSMIDSIDYVSSRSENYSGPENVFGFLRVTFQNQLTYMYEEVPLQSVIDVLTSDSIGSKFNELIKKPNYVFYEDTSFNPN